MFVKTKTQTPSLKVSTLTNAKKIVGDQTRGEQWQKEQERNILSLYSSPIFTPTMEHTNIVGEQQLQITDNVVARAENKTPTIVVAQAWRQKQRKNKIKLSKKAKGSIELGKNYYSRRFGGLEHYTHPVACVPKGDKTTAKSSDESGFLASEAKRRYKFRPILERFQKNQLARGPFVSCLESRIDGPRSYYGHFSLGPFEESKSLTIANALRRTLLSDIPSLAIVSAEINEASHEYAPLAGIRESTLDLLLNLKSIVLKSDKVLEKPYVGYIHCVGPGIVTAADIKLPTGLTCVDPDQYIATLSSDGKLFSRLLICLGKSYAAYSHLGTSSLSEKKRKTSNFQIKNKSIIKSNNSFGPNDTNDTIVGPALLLSQKRQEARVKNGLIKIAYSNRGEKNSLAIDPLFAPVTRVNYVVEREERSFDKIEGHEPIPGTTLTNIHLEIWTNGSISPRLTLEFALKDLGTTFAKLKAANLIQNFTFES
uniref:Plastid-encoded RNA polymerase subunit alpha n=1 Tax=Johansenicoccus eremophilus TaxID=3068301 RepID=A0AA49R3M8_9CHLO|nr:RNA polymerase alpha subunit [Chlorophyceae sp. KF-2023a]